MAYFITLDSTGAIESLYEDVNNNVPDSAIAITDTEFLRLHSVGFGAFTHDGEKLVSRIERDKIERELIDILKSEAIDDLIRSDILRIKNLTDASVLDELNSRRLT